MEAAPSTETNGPATEKTRISWKTKYLALKAKCDQMNQANDVLYSKSRQIYKMIQRAEAEKRILKRRLEQYEVDPRSESHTAVSASFSVAGATDSLSPPSSVPLSRAIFTSPTPEQTDTDFVQSLRQDIAATPSPTPHHPPSLTAPNSHPHHLQPPPSKRPHTTTQPPATPSSAAKTKKKQKAKSSPSTRRKKEHDSGAPKKPSNAFFWFCQEQRRSLEEQFRGEGVAGQHSLTKILAQKWGETTNDDKKKYYLKYTEDKKRYERELQAYHQKKHEQQVLMQEQLQQQFTNSPGRT